MTVEQLNIIITAQTEDFQKKINAVNKALEKTAELAEKSVSSIAEINITSGSSAPYKEEYRNSAEVNGISKNNFEANKLSPETNTAEVLTVPQSGAGVMGAAASVLNLRKGQTLIGAVTENNVSNGGGLQRPIEIFTTVELDGDKVGESVAHYNTARSRITNGFN